MRQVMIQVPQGRGEEAVAAARRHGATNVAMFSARDDQGPIDVATVHVPTRALGNLVDSLSSISSWRGFAGHTLVAAALAPSAGVVGMAAVVG